MNDSLINGALFLSFLLDAFLSIFIIVKSQRKESDYAFAVTALSIGMWTLGILMFRLTDNIESAWLWNREFIVFAGIIASSFMHFSLCITGEKMSKAGKIMLHIPNIFIIGGVFTPDIFIKNIIINSWGKESVLGYYYPLFGCYFIAYVYCSLHKIYINIGKKSGIGRIQLTYVFVATLLTSIVGVYFNLLLILIGNYRYVWVGPYNSLILVLIITYAITKYRLLNISIVISRFVAEALTIVSLSVSYLALVIFHLNLISNKINVVLISWTILYGILVGQIHPKIRLFLQTASDRVFIKGKYNYYKELSNIGSKIANNMNADSIINILSQTFLEVMEVSKATIYHGIELEDEGMQPYLALTGPQVKGEEVIFPCIIENKIVAVIVLGPKLSEDPYSDQDLMLLNNIANQVAVALDRQRLYEQTLETEEEVLMAEKQTVLGRLAANLAHEIKNPLAVLKGMSQAIRDNLDNTIFLNDFRKVVPEEISRIDRLVQEMLAMGQERGQRQIEIDLNEIVIRLMKLFQKRFDKTGIIPKTELASLPAIMGDPDRFIQVFTNLIINAIQAMPNGGELTAITAVNNKGIVIIFRDTGQGIAKESLKDVFEPFFSTKKEGMGLGLSISRKLINEYGGEIDVESSIDKGTTFRIRLPIEKTGHPPGQFGFQP